MEDPGPGAPGCWMLLQQVAVARELAGAPEGERFLLGLGLGRADVGAADRAVGTVFDQPGATLQEVPLPEVGPTLRAGHDGHHVVLLYPAVSMAPRHEGGMGAA